MDLFPLSGSHAFEYRFQNMFNVVRWLYAFFPMGVHLRFTMCTRDWRCTVFEAGRLRKIYYQHGWRQEHCSFFILVSNCWPLTITALSLMTSSGSYCLLGDEPCQQTFSQVSGYRFSSSFFVFSLVLWHWLSKSRWGGQEIHPVYLSPGLHIYNDHLKWGSQSPSPNKFSSWQIAYLLQRTGFSKISLLFVAALNRIDKALILGAPVPSGKEGDCLLNSNGFLYLLRDRIPELCDPFWRHVCNVYHLNHEKIAITLTCTWTIK